MGVPRGCVRQTVYSLHEQRWMPELGQSEEVRERVPGFEARVSSQCGSNGDGIQRLVGRGRYFASVSPW